jgi:lipopolysaccharide export system permease protein
MFRIKKLNIFVAKSFLMLFIGTFLICLFILLMQFLWRWVDELVGKGLGVDVLSKFFFYSAETLVPMAMPLAILLASLITFGNFGERFELLAMKASGISLLKVMRPLAVVVFLLSCLSFYFQNYISPRASLEIGTFALAVKQKSPELDIPEKAFYNEIDGFNLRVDRKNKKTGTLYDVLIYDYAEGFDRTRIIYADSGRLDMTAEQQHIILTLWKGEQFENLTMQTSSAIHIPYRRESFDKKCALIDFNSGFSTADASVMSSSASTKNMRQLDKSIDSLKLKGDSIGRDYYKSAHDIYYQGSVRPQPLNASVAGKAKYRAADYQIDKLLDKKTEADKKQILQRALNNAQNIGTDWSFKSSTQQMIDENIRRHECEWYRKITLALSCLLFFFIGAPLGGIIRKGGLGMPVVISVILFILYYIIDNTGYKMAREGKWIVWMGMWTSTAVLAPLGAFLTYKSNTDSVVMNVDTYIAWIKKVLGIRSVRHLFLKEVIINDPDYEALPAKFNELSEQCRDYIKRTRLKSLPNYYKLWMTDRNDYEVEKINSHMEELIEETSNTKSAILLQHLESYPIIPIHAHTRPFRNYWLNLAAGIIIPVGIFFIFRIWGFRIRLYKDLERIIANDKKVCDTIKDLKTNHKI